MALARLVLSTVSMALLYRERRRRASPLPPAVDGLSKNESWQAFPMASTTTAVGFRSNRPFLGILSLTIGVSIFSVQDAVIKHLSGQYPVHQIVFVRSLASLLLLFAFVILSEGSRGLRSRRLALHVVRGAALFTSYMAYYLGLASMSIAEAIALFFTVPFFVAALSNLVIGEPVGPRR